MAEYKEISFRFTASSETSAIPLKPSEIPQVSEISAKRKQIHVLLVEKGRKELDMYLLTTSNHPVQYIFSDYFPELNTEQ